MQAFEGLGESQAMQSQDLALSRTELSDSAILFENKEKRFLGSNASSVEDLPAAEIFSMQDEEWISPPDSTFTSSSSSSLRSTDETLSETSDTVENVQHSIASGESDKCVSFMNNDGLENACIGKSESDFVNDVTLTSSSVARVPSDPAGSLETVLLPHEVPLAHSGQLDNGEKERPEDSKLLSTKDDVGSSKVVMEYARGQDEHSSCLDPPSQNKRGKKSNCILLLYVRILLSYFIVFF